jgi:hypothetical protein
VGETELERDADGLATGAVLNATAVRGIAANQRMVSVTGGGVRIRRMRFDGAATALVNSIGIAIDKSPDFRIDEVHVSGIGQGIVVSASTGRVSDSFIGPPLGTGILVGGGNLEHPADVSLLRNRLLDYQTGAIALLAAADVIEPPGPFDTLTATVHRNVLTTSLSSIGPSSPYGLRFDAVHSQLSLLRNGITSARVTGNAVGGNHRYALIVNAGQISRDGGVYTADVQLTLKNNEWFAGDATQSRIFITFTNSRMGVAPFWNELATTTQYLQTSRFELRHDGELDSCLIMDPGSAECRVDHPEIEPCDNRVLGNTLTFRPSGTGRTVLPNGTFIPDVCP